MLQSRDLRFDVATALSQGRRDYQEDAVIADFPIGSDLGFVVLSDGMGGHCAGDVASKIVVTEVFSELKIQSGNTKTFEANVAEILLDAAQTANDCVKGYVGLNPETRGMGATLVASVLIRDRLSWVSIGDSPLYLFRKGALRQLNEDHSMAPRIDFMAKSGLMDADEAKDHPDRNCLTSVLIGDKIPQVDCPEEPFGLLAGDILIAASDGLQFLTNDQIETVLDRYGARTSNEIADSLLAAIEQIADPDQDNVSFSVIKIGVSDQSKTVVTDNPVLENELNTGLTEAGRAVRKPVLARHSSLKPLEFLRKTLVARDGAS